MLNVHVYQNAIFAACTTESNISIIYCVFPHNRLMWHVTNVVSLSILVIWNDNGYIGLVLDYGKEWMGIDIWILRCYIAPKSHKILMFVSTNRCQTMLWHYNAQLCLLSLTRTMSTIWYCDVTCWPEQWIWWSVVMSQHCYKWWLVSIMSRILKLYTMIPTGPYKLESP